MCMKVFYSPGSFNYESVIEINGELVTRFGHRSLKQLNEGMCEYIECERNEAIKMIQEAARLPVKEITESLFYEKLQHLAPLDTSKKDMFESYRVCEMFFARITTFYVRYLGRYFMFRDCVDLSQQEIRERIREVQASEDRKDGK